MTAFLSPHEAAVFALETEEMPREAATQLVNTVFGELEEPDRDMLTAGALVLDEETLIARERQQAVAERIWRAMLERAR